MINIFFDGSCMPKNPGGVATYGYVLIKDGKIEKEGRGTIGVGDGMTNNVAEYSGLLEALKFATTKYPDEKDIAIHGDSQLVIRQMKGEYKVKSETAKKYAPQIKKLLLKKNATFT